MIDIVAAEATYYDALKAVFPNLHIEIRYDIRDLTLTEWFIYHGAEFYVPSF
jgi:hypothetical protein